MKPTNVAHIDDQLRSELFANLSERRDILIRQLDRLTLELPDAAADAADQPNEQQMANARHDKLVASLRETDRAIARVEHLDFGSCETCNEAIMADRLRALPDTTRCTDCASAP